MALKGLPVWFWVGAAGVAAMTIGSFGPWAKVFAFEVSGTDGSNDGWLVVGAAALAALALYGYARARRRVLLAVTFLAGAGGIATTLYDRHQVTSSDDEAGLFSGAVQVGWGLNLAMVGSFALAIASLALLARVRHSTRVESAPVEPPPSEQALLPSDRTDP